MGIGDFLAYRLPLAPHWIGASLIRLNFLGQYMYGPAVKKFKDSIPSIDPERLTVDMANYAIKHVPYYRKRYKGLVISSLEQFQREIAFIDKQIVMSAPEEFHSDIARNYVIATTSGTTGRPLEMLMPANRYITELAYVARTWEHDGWHHGARARLRLDHLPKGRDYLINPVTKEYVFDGAMMSDRAVADMHSVIRRSGVEALYTYPMQAYVLLKRWKDLGLDTSVIKLALLTSEAITPMVEDFIENECGITISTFYGHTEKLVFARRRGGIGDFVVEPGYGLAEIVDEFGNVVTAQGQSGEIVGTTFYNKDMPLLRYRTGDGATLGKRVTDFDGVEKQTWSSLRGRNGLVAIRHDGSSLSESVFTFHGDILRHLDGYQTVQAERGRIRFIYKPNALFTKSDLDYIKSDLSDKMLGAEYVDFDASGKFEYSSRGKFALFVSMVKD